MDPDLFCNRWFKRLEDYGTHWGLRHVSFDGKTVAEICDKDFDRLVLTWERVLDDLIKDELPRERDWDSEIKDRQIQKELDNGRDETIPD